MKRTQKEIKMICEEISINVAKAILAEERAEMKQKYEDGDLPILCYDMLTRGYFRTTERIIRNRLAYLNVEKAFETYKRNVEERL